MVIQRSPSTRIAALVQDLLEGDPVRREAAIARLTIAGPRAEASLLKALDDAPPRGQAAVLHALERLATPRGLAAGLARLSSPDPSVAAAAVGAVRPHLQANDAAAAARALDALMEVCLDASRPEHVRLAALEALSDLGESRLAAMRERLRTDPAEAIRKAAGFESGERSREAVAAARLEAMAADPGDDPAAVQELVAEAGARVSLSTLHTLVLRLADRERLADGASQKAAWSVARADVHRTLGERGSRLALFDLRDSLERAPQEAIEALIAAARAVGDGSCLLPLAAVWSRSTTPATREHAARAFHAIVTREGLTRRHAAIRRVQEKWPRAAAAFLATPE
ncbi:MAG TPA: hypothetical protein VIL35_07495 [Vicinamibacterales bacterium]